MMTNGRTDQSASNSPAICERRNGVVLVDLENIRLAWRDYYQAVFTYKDLCSIISELQARFQFDCVFVGIYATESKALEARFSNERHALNCKTRNDSAELRHQFQRERFVLDKEEKAYMKMMLKLKADTKNTKDVTVTASTNNFFDGNKRSLTRCDRLGGSNGKRYSVKLEEFNLKNHQGRKVQRGCDAAIVHDLMIFHFNPAIDSVWCLSGDSDFVDTLKRNAKSPTKEGGVKRWSMVAFTDSFPSELKTQVLRNNHPEIGHLDSFVSVNEVNYFRLEKALHSVNPARLLTLGKRIPITIPNGATLPHNESSIAADQRWQQLEKPGNKNGLRSYEAIYCSMNSDTESFTKANRKSKMVQNNSRYSRPTRPYNHVKVQNEKARNSPDEWWSHKMQSTLPPPGATEGDDREINLSDSEEDHFSLVPAGRVAFLPVEDHQPSQIAEVESSDVECLSVECLSDVDLSDKELIVDEELSLEDKRYEDNDRLSVETSGNSTSPTRCIIDEEEEETLGHKKDSGVRRQRIPNTWREPIIVISLSDDD
eukprot:GHVH01003677.1.p1 GENE.GHVH01003677.1~~GHVH01003677.1.p1  ORF type:complete len:541 (+),score=85.93 GHVH01003677.1:448-2070(+)